MGAEDGESIGGGFLERIGELAERSGRIEDISFDADGIQRVIERLEDLRDLRIGAMKLKSRRFDRIDFPEDFVSYNAVNRVQTFKLKSDEFNDAYLERLEGMIANLRHAKLGYEAREGSIGESMSDIFKRLEGE